VRPPGQLYMGSGNPNDCENRKMASLLVKPLGIGSKVLRASSVNLWQQTFRIWQLPWPSRKPAGQSALVPIKRRPATGKMDNRHSTNRVHFISDPLGLVTLLRPFLRTLPEAGAFLQRASPHIGLCASGIRWPHRRPLDRLAPGLFMNAS